MFDILDIRKNLNVRRQEDRVKKLNHKINTILSERPESEKPSLNITLFDGMTPGEELHVVKMALINQLGMSEEEATKKAPEKLKQLRQMFDR